MMLSDSFMEALEDALWDAAAREVSPAALKQRALVQSIIAVSDAYNNLHHEFSPQKGGRSDSSVPRDQALARAFGRLSRDGRIAAQAVFFTIADAPKLSYGLGELLASGLLPEKPAHILDVGAGCGAQTFSLLGFYAAADLPVQGATITAVDTDRHSLNIMEHTFANLGHWQGGSQLNAQHRDIIGRQSPESIRPGRYDIIVAGTVFNELSPKAQTRLVRRLIDGLSPHGVLLILEPALRETARALHGLRDDLLQTKAAQVVGPCPHQEACPMVAQAGDWCHEHRIWQLPPPRFRKLAHLTTLRRRDLKFAYLTLIRADRPRPETSHDFRVVSPMERTKGKREIQLCSPWGLKKVTCLDRHRGDTNRAFQRLRRGQWVALDPQPDPALHQIKVLPSTRVVATDSARADDTSSQ